MRLLAPIALIGFGFALFVTVTGSDVEDESGTATSREAQTADLGPATETTGTTRDRESQLPDEEYVVKSGDTLEAIAQRTGTKVETLLELNPDLDPQALVSGQRIKLKE